MMASFSRKEEPLPAPPTDKKPERPAQPLALFWREWTTSKQGNSAAQNEDAWAVRVLTETGENSGLLLAVADGATEAVYSRLWARALVQAAEPDWPRLDSETFNQRLAAPRRSFAPIPPGQEVPWFVSHKFKTQGSQATLLVATVSLAANQSAMMIHALAVGDSCLLVFQESGSVYAFPISTSAEFGTDPALIQNRPQPQLKVAGSTTEAQAGDFLLLCTDAVGKWLLECLETKQTDLLFDALLELLTEETPSALVEAATESLPAKPSAAPPPAAEARTEPPSRLQRFLRLFRPDSETGRFSPQPPRDRVATPIANRAESVSHFQAAAEAPQQPQKLATSEAESALAAAKCQAPAVNSNARFEQFIERQRQPGSKPRMRNDDSTLIICVPVNQPAPDQAAAASEIIRRYKAAAQQRPLVVRRGKLVNGES